MTLLEIARALSSQTTINGVVSVIIDKVQVLLQVQRCTVFIVDHSTNELIIWRDYNHNVQFTFLDWITGHHPSPQLQVRYDLTHASC